MMTGCHQPESLMAMSNLQESVKKQNFTPQFQVKLILCRTTASKTFFSEITWLMNGDHGRDFKGLPNDVIIVKNKNKTELLEEH